MTRVGVDTRRSTVGIEPPPAEAVEAIVRTALAEDRACEDVTTAAVVEGGLRALGRLLPREDGVVCGLGIVDRVFAALDASVVLTAFVGDGDSMAAGSALGTVDGPASALLRGERTALNLLQRLSGVATLTRRFVDAVAARDCLILDTRKTTPGLRDLDKYAVRCGGGTNHRRDLAVMAMIKDNHREAIVRQGGTLSEAAAAIRQRAPGVPVEVEIDALGELPAALEARPEWILLDNMEPALMREAVAIVGGRAKLEASGGVTLATVDEIAATGVDAISVGALTHSAPALDISLDIAFGA